MKKSIFAILAIAACFASCSKVVESPVLDNAISFDTYVGRDAVTKASVINLDDLKDSGVKVNAYIHESDETLASGTFQSNFMLNQTVTTEGLYAPAKYWPAVDKSIDFVAWVPVAAATVTGDNLTFTVSPTATQQFDLLVADPVIDMNGARITDENARKVSLQFKHLLSRIRFSITGNSLPTDGVNVVQLTELSLNGSFASEGTVNMRAAAPKVAATTGKTTTKYEITGDNFGYTNDVISNGETFTNSSSYLMLIPDGNKPEYITLSYKVTTYEVELKDDGTVKLDDDGKPVLKLGDDDKPIESGEPVVNTAHFKITEPYVAGHAYLYTFSITMDAIEFDVTEEQWVVDAEGTENDKPEEVEQIVDNHTPTTTTTEA